MSDPMRIRAVANGDKVEVKILMSHVMETGQRKDADGAVVPAHYIVKVVGTCNGREAKCFQPANFWRAIRSWLAKSWPRRRCPRSSQILRFRGYRRYNRLISLRRWMS